MDRKDKSCNENGLTCSADLNYIYRPGLKMQKSGIGNK